MRMALLASGVARTPMPARSAPALDQLSARLLSAGLGTMRTGQLEARRGICQSKKRRTKFVLRLAGRIRITGEDEDWMTPPVPLAWCATVEEADTWTRQKPTRPSRLRRGRDGSLGVRVVLIEGAFSPHGDIKLATARAGDCSSGGIKGRSCSLNCMDGWVEWNGYTGAFIHERIGSCLPANSWILQTSH